MENSQNLSENGTNGQGVEINIGDSESQSSEDENDFSTEQESSSIDIPFFFQLQIQNHINKAMYSNLISFSKAACSKEFKEVERKIKLEILSKLNSAGLDFELDTIDEIFNFTPDYNISDNLDRTPLHWFTWFRDEVGVNFLLSKEIDINAQTEFGMTALHYAALRNSPEIALNLLLAGIDTEIQSRYFKYEGKEFNVINHKQLLILHDSKKSLKEDDSNTDREYPFIEYPGGTKALDIAVKLNNTKIVELINTFLAHKANALPLQAEELRALTARPTSPAFICSNLTWAVLCGDLEKTSEFLAAPGADPNVRLDDSAKTPLLVYAARHYDQPMCELLLSKGADVNACDEKGYTGTYYAAKSRQLPLFETFVRWNADLNINFQLKHIIHGAIEGGNAEILKLLLSHNVSVDVEDDAGNTPLHRTAMLDKPLLLELLLKHNADKERSNQKGNTALHEASENDSLQCVNILLSYGSDSSVKNKDGKTALQLADTRQHRRIIDAISSRQTPSETINKTSLQPSQDLLLACQNNNDSAIMAAIGLGADINFVKAGMTPLHYLAQHENIAMLENLIQRGANVNAKNLDGVTPLFSAIIHQKIRAVRKLLEANSNPFITIGNTININNYKFPANSQGLDIAEISQNREINSLLQQYAYRAAMHGKEATALNKLFAAVKARNVELVRNILANYPNLSACQSDQDGRTLLWHAVVAGIEMARIIIEKIQTQFRKGRDSFNFIKMVTQRNNGTNILASNALDVAARAMNGLSLVRYLVELESFNLNEQRPSCGTTPLVGACFIGEVDIVKYLCEKGASPEIANNDGENALLIAAGLKNNNNSHLIVDYLLSQDVEAHVKNHKGKNAIHFAALAGNLLSIKSLCAKNVAYDEADEYGWTPLMGACAKSQTMVVEYLLTLGADVNKVTNGGWSVLGIAAGNGATDCLRLLLEKNVNYNDSFNNNSFTPLMIASQNGHIETINVLLEKSDIKVNLINKNKESALILATIHRKLDIMKLLLQHGADPNQADHEGWTPLTIAAANNTLDALELLLTYSDRLNINYIHADIRYSVSALGRAGMRNNPAIVARLLREPKINVNVFQYTNYGFPLTLFVHHNATEPLKLLLEHSDLDLTVAGPTGLTAIEMAESENKSEIAVLLQKAASQRAMKRLVDFPLIKAAYDGNINEIQRLLNEADFAIDINENVSCFECSGGTALYYAARNGHAAAVKLLINAPGIQINCRHNFTKQTPLHIAAINNHTEVLTILLEREEIDANAVALSQQTALMHAAKCGNYEALAALLASPKVDPNQSTPHLGNDGWSPLQVLADLGNYGNGTNDRANYLAMVETFLKRDGIDVNIRNAHWAGHFTSLIRGVECSAVCRELLKHPSVNINLVTQHGYSALAQAASAGYTETLYMLLASPGIDVNLPLEKGLTPLHCAAKSGHVECVRALLTVEGIDVNRKDYRGREPLIFAVKEGHTEITRILIERSEENSCRAALEAAVKLKKDLSEQIINMLIDNIDGMYLKNNYNRLREKALSAGNLKIPKLLRSYLNFNCDQQTVSSISLECSSYLEEYEERYIEAKKSLSEIKLNRANYSKEDFYKHLLEPSLYLFLLEHVSFESSSYYKLLKIGIEDAKIARELTKANSLSYTVLGLLLIQRAQLNVEINKKLEQFKKALNLFEEALYKNPQCFLAEKARGLCLVYLEKFDKINFGKTSKSEIFIPRQLDSVIDDLPEDIVRNIYYKLNALIENQKFEQSYKQRISFLENELNNLSRHQDNSNDSITNSEVLQANSLNFFDTVYKFFTIEEGIYKKEIPVALKLLERIKSDFGQLNKIEIKEEKNRIITTLNGVYRALINSITGAVLVPSAKSLAIEKLSCLGEFLVSQEPKDLYSPHDNRSFSESQTIHGIRLSQTLLSRYESKNVLLQEIYSHAIEYSENVGVSLYICYAWPSEKNIKKEYWVQSFLRKLYEDLKRAGVAVKLDIESNFHGNNIYTFMQGARDADFVLVVGTESLLEKHTLGFTALASELISILDKRKADNTKGLYRVLPIILSGNATTALPAYFRMYTTIKDWVGQSYLSCLQQLIGTIYQFSEADLKEGKYYHLWQKFKEGHDKTGILSEPLPDEAITSFLQQEDAAAHSRSEARLSTIQSLLQESEARISIAQSFFGRNASSPAQQGRQNITSQGERDNSQGLCSVM